MLLTIHTIRRTLNSAPVTQWSLHFASLLDRFSRFRNTISLQTSAHRRLSGLAQLLLSATALLIQHSVALASTSVVLTPAMKGTATLPNTSPFHNLLNWRIEGQADRFESQKSNVGLFEIDSSVQISISTDDTLVVNGFGCSQIGLPLGSTLTFRYVARRDTSAKSCSLEIWDQQTGEYRITTAAMTSTEKLDRANLRFAIGSFYEPSSPAIQLGFLRWYSTAGVVGGNPPPLVMTSAGDLLDFEFEGNLRDSSPHRANFSFTSGNVSYETTAQYAPGINLATVPMTVRTASPVRLDAVGSFSNTDSVVLTCVWESTTSPQSYSGASSKSEVPGAAVWHNQNTCTPSFTPLTFGSYGIRLQIRDGTGHTAMKEFKIGAVATDDNYVVQFPDAAVEKVLGPQIMYGKNPWPWADERNKTFADIIINSLDALWPDNWNVPATGQIIARHDDTLITGTDTHFLSDACSASGNKLLVVWYPSSDYPGTTGRGLFGIDSCPDDTHLTISKPYTFNDKLSTEPMSYALWDVNDAASWKGLYGGNAMGRITFNYYDNGLALYALYYRTGIDEYRTAARKLEDMWWTCPYVDRGNAFNYTPGSNTPVSGFWNVESRTTAPLGMVLRAVDGAPEMFTGLRHLWDLKIFQLSSPQFFGSAADHREEGFSLDTLALCASFDSSYDSKCLAGLRTAADQTLTPLHKAWNGLYHYIVAQGASFPSAGGWGFGVKYKVVDGSTAVTLATGSTPAGLKCGSGNYSCEGTFYIIFGNFGTDTPPDNSAFDARGYSYSVTNEATLTLTEPYDSGGVCPAPAGCLKGFEVHEKLGYGVISYMAGAYAHGADMAAQAFSNAGDTIYADKYTGYMSDAVDYIQNAGYSPDFKGTYSTRYYINCEPIGSDVPAGSRGLCVGEALAARQNNAELIPGLARAYARTKNPDLKNFIDTLYSATFAKPGYGKPPVSPDGNYEVYLNDGGYMIATTNGVLSNYETNKWFGYFFGYGNASGWPAIRASVGALSGRTPLSAPRAGARL